MAALDDLKVLDLSTGVAPAITTMLLADFGADVLRVEHRDVERAPDRSAPGFAMWDRNKRLSLADPVNPADRERLESLIAACDIVVTQGATDELLTPAELDDLFEKNPSVRRIVLSMPAFADWCHWPSGRESNELVASASGMSLRSSSETEAPIDPVYQHILYVQGMWAATSVLSAVRHRAQTGEGQTVTVGGAHAAAIAGCATSIVDPDNLAVLPPAGNGGPNATYTRYQCSDGEWLFLGALTPKFQIPTFELLGLDDILTDPRIKGDLDAMLTVENRGWVRDRMAEVFAAKPREQWLDELHRIGVPAGPLLQRDEWLDHEQILSIGMRAEVADPHRGTVVMPAVPINLADTPGEIRSAAPSRDDAIELPAWEASPVSDAPGGSASGPGPLAGIQVLDLGTVLAGPLAGSLLAELGADVVKVEPLSGDPFRVKGIVYNRGMRSLAINLRDDDAREAFYDLVRCSDIVIDNFRPGVLERLGIDYETLQSINDRIITLSFTGYGHAGPLKSEPGFDPVLQAMSGMMRAQGGDGDPVFLTMAVNDISSAAIGTVAATVALHHRERTGKGQPITGSLAATSVFMQSGEITRFKGRSPARYGGSEYAGPGELDRFYATRDGWVRLQATEDQRPLLEKAGVTGDLAQAIAGRDRDELVAALTAVGVDAVAAYHPNELIDDQRLLDSVIIQEQTRPSGRPYFASGRLARFSGSERSDAIGPPGLGEHTAEILAAAGVTHDRVEALLSNGAVATGAPMLLDKFVPYR